jgi:hypothetical protein
MVSALHVAAPAAAWGAASSPGRCAALKAKAAGMHVAASLACHAVAARKGGSVSSACLAQARQKLERLFAKAEKKGTCGAPGDATTIAEAGTLFVAGIAAAILPGGSPDDARRCAAKKLLRAGAYGRGRLACWARAFRAGTPVDGACFDGSASKLIVGFRAAETKPGCATTGDAAAIETVLNGFVDEVADLVLPATTTTTIVATSTTIGGGATTSTTTTEALVSFSADVQPIFTANCALAGCHIAPGAEEGMDLSRGKAYAAIVNVTSRECGQFKRVLPGQPDASYLVFKITGPPQPCFDGVRMPRDAPPLSAADQATIRDWIRQGAPNN